MEVQPASRPYAWIPVAVLTAVAAGLRLYRLDAYAFWYDEWYNTIFGNILDPDARFIALTNGVVWRVIQTFWQMAGSSDFWLRLLPALLGTATIPAVYAMVRSLVDKRVALLTAGFLAVHPLHIYFCQTFRKEAFLVLLAVLALHAYTKILNRGNRRDFAAFTVCAVLAIITQPVLLAFIVPLSLTVPLRGGGPGRLRRWLIANGMVVIAIGLYDLWILLLVSTYGKEVWPLNPTLPEIAKMVTTLFFGYHLPVHLLYPAGILASIVFLYGLYVEWRWHRRLFILILAITGSTIAVQAVADILGYPIFVARYLAFFLPVLCLHLSVALSRIRSPGLCGALAALFVFFTAVSAMQVYQDPPIKMIETHQRADYRALARFLQSPERFQPGDVVGHYHRASTAGLLRYAPDIENRHLVFDLPECTETNRENIVGTTWLEPFGLHDYEAEEELRDHRRAWLVFSEWQHDKPAYNYTKHPWRRSPTEAILHWMQTHYRQVPFRDENGGWVTSKAFDNKQWFKLYLFELKASPEPPPAHLDRAAPGML